MAKKRRTNAKKALHNIAIEAEKKAVIKRQEEWQRQIEAGAAARIPDKPRRAPDGDVKMVTKKPERNEPLKKVAMDPSRRTIIKSKRDKNVVRRILKRGGPAAPPETNMLFM